MSLAIVFPGQGSQSLGMLSDLGNQYPSVMSTCNQASDVLGYDIWKLMQSGPEQELNRTEKTQPALLTAGVAIWNLWKELGGQSPRLLAGHSLGEYTALVASGVLEFQDAVKLVQERGRLMQAAVPEGVGAMAAILGLEDELIKQVCTESAQGEIVSAANFNSPGQVVIAGNINAVNRATEAAKAAGAKRAIILPVSVPSHCLLMQDAAGQLLQNMNKLDFHPPGYPVIHNVDAGIHKEPDAIRAILSAQLFQSVQWVKTVQTMAQQGITRIIEFGPGKVLAGLIKRIDKTIETLTIYDPESLDIAIKQPG